MDFKRHVIIYCKCACPNAMRQAGLLNLITGKVTSCSIHPSVHLINGDHHCANVYQVLSSKSKAFNRTLKPNMYTEAAASRMLQQSYNDFYVSLFRIICQTMTKQARLLSLFWQLELIFNHCSSTRTISENEHCDITA